MKLRSGNKDNQSLTPISHMGKKELKIRENLLRSYLHEKMDILTQSNNNDETIKAIYEYYEGMYDLIRIMKRLKKDYRAIYTAAVKSNKSIENQIKKLYKENEIYFEINGCKINIIEYLVEYRIFLTKLL